MEQTNLTNLDQVLHLLGKGQFIDAMTTYFADDVVIQEVGQAPKEGKAHCISVEEELLQGVSEFIQYTSHSRAASGDKTFYEATMEFKTKDGQHIKQQQAVVSTWRDGKIVDERYYHRNA